MRIAIVPVLHRLSLLLLKVACTSFWPSTAQALNCYFSIGNINFGNVNPTAASSTTASQSIEIICDHSAPGTMRVCLHLGPGTGGSGSNANPRYLKNGTRSLSFNLFSDPSFTTIWGSHLEGWSGVNPIQVDIPLVGTGGNYEGSAVRTIYGRVPGGQSWLPPGNYSSELGIQALYDLSTAGSCSTISAGEEYEDFVVAATVINSCGVSATTLNFGSVTALTTALNGTGTISVTCTSGIAYQIGLDGGTAGATDPTQRKMSNGGQQITYGLYRDSARTLSWGSTIGSNTRSGTGNGSTQNITVFGRVPIQTTPSPGIYTDTIVVTVTY